MQTILCGARQWQQAVSCSQLRGHEGRPLAPRALDHWAVVMIASQAKAVSCIFSSGCQLRKELACWDITASEVEVRLYHQLLILLLFRGVQL